jgi:hypothetical protein
MKQLLLLISLMFASQVMAVCSSPISRPAYSALTTLTASSLNTNLDTVYTRANELPGDCVTDATISSDKLSTDLNPVLKGIKEGCFVSRSTAAIITVDKCYLAVNGNMVTTTSANTVTMACSGCSAEVAGTTYYVYAKTGSTGSTLNLNISTTAPGADGYNVGGDRVLARFLNNAASDIDQYSIDQWIVNRFVAQQTGPITFSPVGTWVSNTTYAGIFRRNGSKMEGQITVATSGAPTSATLSLSFPSSYTMDDVNVTANNFGGFGSVTVSDSGSTFYDGEILIISNIGGIDPRVSTSSGTYSVATAITQAFPITFGASDSVIINFSVPILGWSD